ncbi:hypothetical protein [Microcoleus sp. herbarium14]|uniref:hypothetical protein n=1 Tax=Microcoleus sp. herbarium14 TaxID=3055439 RepID=UPI002FD60DD5
MTDTNNWSGIGRQVLDQFLNAEKGTSGGDAGQFGIDAFTDGFEDEFPGDSDDLIGGTYAGYSLEANRASENRPWGGSYGDRPKIHELNQPPAAQALGWRVIDFYPNRDHKSEFYRLAGTPAELRQMMQIVQATRFVTGARVNFEAWFELWEKGFLYFTENRSDSNFLLNGDKQWERIKKPESRPRFREWTNSQQRADYGFRVIEYWRDRSNEAESVLLTGTDLQLIQHIIQIEYEGGGSASKSQPKNWPPMKGQPEIKLYFRGEKRAQAETSFRIMNKTDDPKIPLPLIGKSDLRTYARKIKEQFATPDLFVWEKGREVLSYKNRWQGFDGQWWLCRNETAGRSLLTKILAVSDLNLDISKIRMSKAVDEATTFPTDPPDITVLGQQVSQPTERPLVDVAFWRAEITLSKLAAPIPLVERGTVVYD